MGRERVSRRAWVHFLSGKGNQRRWLSEGEFSDELERAVLFGRRCLRALGDRCRENDALSGAKVQAVTDKEGPSGLNCWDSGKRNRDSETWRTP
jgi:hypothetical protein